MDNNEPISLRGEAEHYMTIKYLKKKKTISINAGKKKRRQNQMKKPFQQVLSQIESWGVEVLYVSGKYFANWFEKMCLINSLSKIRIISLYNCKITSIQPFVNLQMPWLQNLFLSKNNITNFKPLVRLNCKKLEVLSLDKNMSVDLERVLPNCNFIHNIQTLMIQSYPQSRVQQQSTNWISKLLNIKSTNNSKLSMQFRNIGRINQKIRANYKYIFEGRNYEIFDKYNMGFLISDDESSMSSQQQSRI